MRTAASFDRPHLKVPAYQELLYIDQGGTNQSEKNIYIASIRVVSEIVENWDQVYKNGVTPGNYVGDIFRSLKGAVLADIGSDYHQEG